MPLDTDLNVAPYFDDYNEEKNFHRVLFKPTVAVQARELTQLQTILQNQIERFGDNLFKTGTIIRGCSITTDYNYEYIKIRDQLNDGAPVSLASYSNTLLIQESSNLQSLVVNYVNGFESTDPNLSTLYIKYQNTGTSGEKVYANGQVIKIFDRSRTIEDVIINNGGSLYTNSDVVVFTGGEGSGATATIVTDTSGTITDVSITSKGTGYTSAPNVSITTSTGSSANLTAKNYIGEIVVANSSFTAPVGIGVAVRVSEGIIYQKGNFIRVDNQETIVEKYSKSPNNVVVGFLTNESSVNSNVDDTLLDLATGVPNFAAPGADRLKLTPQLVSISKDQAAANADFLALLEYENGKVVRDRTRTQYNYIGKELNRRTFDESGNYVLDTIKLSIADKTGNTTHLDLVTSPGIAYVNGERIELLNDVRVPLRKGTDTANSINQTINTVYGSYVIVKELLGIVNIKEGSVINLRDTAATDITDNVNGTPTAPGSLIGTARVRSIEFDSGIPGTPAAQYRVYLFDIRMSSGKSFKDVRSLSIGSTAIADIVLNSLNSAELYDIDNDIFVFQTGTNAVKELTQEEFIFRTSTNAIFTSAGDVTISFSGGNTLPYGAGTLSDVQKRNDFILIPTTSFRYQSNSTGTVSANTTNTNVIGVGTAFTTSFDVGDYIVVGNNTVFSAPQRIVSVSNNTLLTVAGTFAGLSGGTANAVSNGVFKAFPSNVPVDLTKIDREITVNSNTSLTVSVGQNINTTASFVLYHDLKNFEPAVRVKTLENPVYIKLSTGSIRANRNGPWCVGIPDVLSIEGVYIGSGNSYSEATTNFASQFELDNGQKDNFYGLSYIKRAPGATISLTDSNCLLVKVKAFTHSSGKYISTESYPVSNTVPLPSDKIKLEQIPVYISAASGEAFSLRDCLDFRPIVSNTAVLSTTAAGASIDPSSIETFNSTEKFFPSPTKQFECSIESYLSRIDRVILGQDGRIKIKEGVPSNSPSAPEKEAGTMDLGIINVAPFPSLSAKAASVAKRPDLKNLISLLQTRRYTMKDISDIEQRLQRLEYYTLLNTLEANTKNLVIPSDANGSIEVFKNGFFVDSFDTYEISDLNDGEYKAQVDTSNSRLVPQQEIIPIDLTFNSSNSSNVVKSGDLITLNYNEKPLVSQTIANKIRTLTEQFWRFAGNMTVVPRVDNFFDTEVVASSSIDINIADPITSLVNAQNEINARVTQNSRITNNTTTRVTGTTSTNFGPFVQTDTNFSRTTTTTTTTSGSRIELPPVVTATQNVGNLLTSVQVSPFIREQRIGLFVRGLRPGAQHYVFFDNVDVTSRAIQAAVRTQADLSSVSNFRPLYDKVTAQSRGLFASNNGTLALVVDLPGDTFTTGEKQFLVMDIPALNSEASATSKSIGQFSAFALQGQSTNLTATTRSFDLRPSRAFSVNTFTTTSVVNSTINWTESQIEFTGGDGGGGFGGDGGGDGGGSGDPLGQTFLVQKQDGGDIIYATSIDLFFRDKDTNNGVTLELREVSDTGYPTDRILPFSRVYKESSEVNISNTASIATKFTFSSPVPLKVNNEYAIICTPDGNSPNYRVWSAEVGTPDVANNALGTNQAWGLGTMFFSTSNKAYSAIQNEDMKFTVYRANTLNSSGHAILNNADYEFLTVNSVSGSFRGGESVAQYANSYLNTAITTNTSSYTISTSSSLTSAVTSGDYVLIVYGTDQALKTGNVQVSTTTVTNAAGNTTAFTADYSNGEFIRIGNEIRQIISVNSDTSITLDTPFNGSYSGNVHYEVTPKFDIVRVESANSTTITVDRPPSYTVNTSIAASIQKVVRGVAAYYSGSKGKLYLKESNSSNTTFNIKVSNTSYLGYLVGDISDALAKVVSIDEISGVNFTPLINTLIVPSTNLTLKGTFTKQSGGTDTQNYPFSGASSVNINDTAVIKSKTLELSTGSLVKSFTANVQFTTAFTDTAPIIDINPSSILFTKYNINNTSTDENTRYGNAQCKYISKRIFLNEGLDAEDIKVFLRAYKPVNTDIELYAKVLNSTDGELFDDKDWSQLKLVTDSNLFSSSLDKQDLKEYEYTFKLTPQSTILPGVIEVYSNTTVDGTGVQFTASFNANTDVDTANDTITITNHRYRNGDIVKYSVDSGNTAITTLVANRDYYIVNATTSTVKLSLTEGGSPVELQKGSTEAGHNLNIISAGDLVKIVQSDSESSYDIIPVASVVSNTEIVLASNTSFSGAGYTIEKVTKPREAFKYNRNDSIVRYYDSSNRAYDTYKYLAIKIVLKSENGYTIPEVDDVRTIAISV